MKTLFFILIVSSLGLSWHNKPGLTKIEAERILGQTARLAEEKEEVKDGVTRYRITYEGLENEPVTNRAVNLHYSLTKYSDPDLAKKAYADILKSNTGMPGQTPLSGIGNEALYHSDDANFCLIIVRKQAQLLLMKVNKMTKKFSAEELKSVTRRIVSGL